MIQLPYLSVVLFMCAGVIGFTSLLCLVMEKRKLLKVSHHIQITNVPPHECDTVQRLSEQFRKNHCTTPT
jgi:hypothetical protein